jgi:hypothetical protein
MLFGILLSCTKEAARPGAAALTIVNAVPDSDPSLLPIFGGTQPLTWYAFAAQIPYGVSFVTGSYSGTQALTIYHYPDTTEHSTPLFDLTLHLPVNTIHTLFLTGTMAAPDTLFTTDALPNFPSSDSSLGIRFVNLSYGSAPVSVNITGLAQGSEVNSLPYKGLTGFIHYPATSGVSDYTFEFRDAASGDLIGSCLLSGVNETFLNTRRYRNFTMAFTGVPNDPSTLKIILIEAYSSY